MSIETKTLECECGRTVSSTLANFNAIGESICPDCGEVLES